MELTRPGRTQGHPWVDLGGTPEILAEGLGRLQNLVLASDALYFSNRDGFVMRVAR